MKQLTSSPIMNGTLTSAAEIRLFRDSTLCYIQSSLTWYLSCDAYASNPKVSRSHTEWSLTRTTFSLHLTMVRAAPAAPRAAALPRALFALLLLPSHLGEAAGRGSPATLVQSSPTPAGPLLRPTAWPHESVIHCNIFLVLANDRANSLTNACATTFWAHARPPIALPPLSAPLCRKHSPPFPPTTLAPRPYGSLAQTGHLHPAGSWTYNCDMSHAISTPTNPSIWATLGIQWTTPHPTTPGLLAHTPAPTSAPSASTLPSRGDGFHESCMPHGLYRGAQLKPYSPR